VKWVLVLALVMITLSLSACVWMFTDLKAPKVSLIAIEPLHFGLFEQRFNLRLRLQNTNDTELPIRGMVYALQLNGADFAQGVSDQEITLPEYGEEVIDVPVVANLGRLLRQLTRIDSDRIRYKLSGHMGLMNKTFKLPFDYEGEVDFGF